MSFAISFEPVFNPTGGKLILNSMTGGSPINVYATVDSIPVLPPSGATAESPGVTGGVFLNGPSANITRINDAFGLAYNPRPLTNWLAPPPSTVQDALDRLAAKFVSSGLGPV